MKWQDVCENKTLRDLPFKIELNKWGQIVMSPVKIKHSFYRGRIQRLLESLTAVEQILDCDERDIDPVGRRNCRQQLAG